MADLFDTQKKKKVVVKKVVKKQDDDRYTIQGDERVQIFVPKENAEAVLAEYKIEHNAHAHKQSEFEGMVRFRRAPTEQVALLWPLHNMQEGHVQKQARNDVVPTYDEMLKEIMSKLNMAADTQSNKTVEPQLQKITPTKFKVTNFDEVAGSLHRSLPDVAEFLLKQLQCEGGFDQDNKALLIKQRVNQQQIKDIIAKYKTQFVVCGNCGSIQTVVSKSENGKDWVLVCESCKAHRHLKK